MPVITKIAPEGGLIGQAESPRERDRLAERPQSAEKGQVRDEFRCRAGSEGANVDGCAERRQQWHGAPGYRGWATNEDREPSRLSPGEAADKRVHRAVRSRQAGPGRDGSRRLAQTVDISITVSDARAPAAMPSAPSVTARSAGGSATMVISVSA